MSNDETEVAAGSYIDALGVTMPMSDNDHLTEVLVIGKVHNLDTGSVSLLITSNDLDWITKWGLHTAAADVMSAGTQIVGRDDIED